jgi:hypothetical protein
MPEHGSLESWAKQGANANYSELFIFYRFRCFLVEHNADCGVSLLSHLSFIAIYSNFAMSTGHIKQIPTKTLAGKLSPIPLSSLSVRRPRRASCSCSGADSPIARRFSHFAVLRLNFSWLRHWWTSGSTEWSRLAIEKSFQKESHFYICLFQAAHPSPLSSYRFFGCKCFSKTNAQLKVLGHEPINWCNLR